MNVNTVGANARLQLILPVLHYSVNFKFLWGQPILDFKKKYVG